MQYGTCYLMQFITVIFFNDSFLEQFWKHVNVYVIRQIDYTCTNWCIRNDRKYCYLVLMLFFLNELIFDNGTEVKILLLKRFDTLHSELNIFFAILIFTFYSVFFEKC